MNPITNPFSPGAGAPPPELAGRDNIFAKAEILFARVLLGRSEKSSIMTGLRGVGKTVLLNNLNAIAIKHNFKALTLECHDGKSLAALLAPGLRQILFSLDRMGNLSHKARRGLAVFKSFMSGLKIVINEVELGINAEPGTADSGDIEADLPDLFIAVAEAAKDRGTAVVIFIDELQYLEKKDFSALIMAIHRVSQRGLPLILIGAGLPQLPSLAGNSKSYAERLFDFPDIGPLQADDVRKALLEPALKMGGTFTDEAIDEIIKITQGYPYFLQEWGYHCWNLCKNTTIGIETVHEATTIAIQHLDKAFFRVRFDRLSQREREYLRALAEYGPGTHRSGDVAEILNSNVNSLGPIRDSLIKKGMIYSPSYGATAFTVPLFDQFMVRIMENVPKNITKREKK